MHCTAEWAPAPKALPFLESAFLVSSTVFISSPSPNRSSSFLPSFLKPTRVEARTETEQKSHAYIAECTFVPRNPPNSKRRQLRLGERLFFSKSVT